MRRPSPLSRVAAIALGCAMAACIAARAGATWLSDGVPLCTESHGQFLAAIVPDGLHGATVIWNDSRFGEDIFGQRVDQAGVPLWSTNGLAVCTEVHQQITATAMPYGNGAVVVWADHRNGEYDIYGQRVDGNGLPQWTFDGIPIGSGSGDDMRPIMIYDGRGGIMTLVGWIVLWVNDDGFASDLRVNHVYADGSLLSPANGGGTTLASSLTSLGGIAMASDGVGTVVFGYGATAAWSENRNGGAAGYDIYARRINNSGVVQWSGNGVPVCDLNGDQQNPAMVNTGASVTIVWDDQRTPDRNIWAQKLDASGVSQWLADGLPVCQASGSQVAPKLVSDQAGGVIVVWTDARSGTNKIYAQRLDANGQRLWTPADGIPVCGASGAQFNPAVVTDGAGGIIVAWQDRRGADDDLYAQRLDPNGNLLWTLNGAPLSRSIGNQQSVQVTSDGASGVVAAWTDLRSGVQDIFANRIEANGTVDVPGLGPEALGLTALSPNPARGEVRMRLDLPRPARVTAEVLDVTGRSVRVLRSGAQLGVGAHVLAWDGADESGARTPAGVFFVRVRAGDEVLATRVVRLR